MSTSPHLLYSQAAPPYFLCINGDSYFYTKLKQMAFQLRRARKTHRAQPLRLKRKKKIIIYTPGLKILNICDKYAFVALNWIQSSKIANAAASPAFLPLLPLQASGALRVSALNFLRLLEKKSSFTLWHFCSPGKSWPGRQGEHTATAASQEGEPALPWRDKSDLSTSRRICFIIFFPKILRFKFCSSS